MKIQSTGNKKTYIQFLYLYNISIKNIEPGELITIIV